MKAITRTLRPTRMALIVAAASLMPLAAQAQNADMQARYQADLQRCATLSDTESQRTCRQEAGAALSESRRNRLVTGNADTAANAAARCARLPSVQRADCERLMSDSSAVEHGSVSGGGVLRELTITVPADSTTTGSYGAQPVPAPGYTAPPAPTPGYGTPPAPTPPTYNQPAPAAPYGTAPAR